MNVSEAEALLRELAPVAVGLVTEVGRRGHPPHDYAYLQISSPTDPSNLAIVSTPGDRWFELCVGGGYLTGETGDLYSDSDVREILELNVSRALCYLDGNWAEGKSGLFRVPYVTLHTESGPVKLRLSTRETMRNIFSR